MTAKNIRSGDGAGAGMGFRGGKGKPGYPVPDIIRNREEPTETGILDIVEDVVSQMTATPGMVQKTTWDISDERDPLDIVVRDVVSGLVKRESKEKGEDLGFGFNEDGFPIQDEYDFQGLPVSVENKRGSIRKWYDKDGKEKGSTEMYSDYGYIDGYIGADGEPVDVYVGPTEDAEYAYVVHQNKAPDFENYDEDKVMLGFPSEESARESYKRQYNDERFYGGMSSMPMEKFKAKLKKGGKITNEARLREAAAPKMIAHLDDLKPEEFLRFLQKYREMPIKGGLEISEKVDGSAQMTFGAKGGNLWTKSKHGQVKTRADEYDDRMSLPLRMAHTALESVGQFMPDGVIFVSDVLYSRIPNSIEYGENRIVIHGVHAGGKNLSEIQCKKAVGEMVKLAGDLSDGKEDWKLEYKHVLDPKEVMVDTEAEYKSLGEIFEALQELHPDRLKVSGKEAYKAALTRFQTVQKALKKKLVDQLRKQSSAYGPKGGDVEGLVFKDLETGAMTKLVDKEYFTKLNKFLWNYRELLDKGVKVGDKWEFGVLQKFRNSVADKVMGAPAAKAPNFVNTLRDFGSELEYPSEADTPEKKSDYLLSQYIEENDLMQGDFIANFKRELEVVRKDFDKLKADWDEKKKGDLVFNMKNDSDETIRSVKMDPLIKARTDDSFNGMDHFLSGALEALEAIRGMKGDLTKRTALLKLMLGQGRLAKLKTPSEEPVQESVLVEADLGAINRVVTNFAGKLAKKGIKVGAKLGNGANGVAYDIGGGKVLKVTEDPDEATASNHLLGKNIEGVAKFYDVFRFPSQDELYGIVLEKLEKLNPQVQMELDSAIEFLDKASFGWEAEWEKAKDFLMNRTNLADRAKKAIDTIEKYGINEILDTLKKNQVDWMDVHTGNLMMRGGKIVAFDLGTSDSPGKEPPTLEGRIVENVISTLGEARADKVGVTVGRFQPFHKGHAAVIRDLTKRFNKVIVIVAGNTKDDKNPFSYDLRLEMMQKSLPDVMSKVEVHKATYGGKNSGYVPGVLSDISKNTDSSVTGDTAVTVLVGQDRLADMQKQMSHAAKSEEELSFDPSMAVVEALPDVKNDDDADRVSGTRVREAVVQGKEDVVRSMMDPHLVSNPGDFEKIYAEMKKELGADKEVPMAEAILEGILDEVIADIGGEKGVMEILQVNKDRLQNSKWHIQVDNLKRLGMGAEGIAFDIGSNRVLKVTADEAEAKTSYGLLGKTSPHVVHIFDVFGFPGLATNAPARDSAIAGQGGKHPAYGIVTEKLTPLNDTEGKEFDDATDWLVGGARTAGGTEVGDIPPDVKLKVQPLIRTGKWDQAMEVLGQILKDDSMKEVGSTDPNNPRVMRVAQRRFLDLKNTFDKFKLPQIVKELAAMHIEFSDFHSGNLMKRGSDYVINDLGRSEGPSNKVPPKLGETVDRIMEQLVLEFDMGTGMGSSVCNVRGGSSAVSSFKNPADPNSKDEWQTQLSRLQLFGSGALPEELNQFAQKVIEHAQDAPVYQMEQWIPLSELSAPFLEHRPHTNAGRGETAFAIEQHLRGHNSRLTGLNNSYDNESDMKYEVKEFGTGGVRVEKTAIPATGDMLEFMKSFVNGLRMAMSEIQKERPSTEDWLQPHGMALPELKAFITMAESALAGDNLSRGLMGMTTQRVLPINFEHVSKVLGNIFEKNKRLSKNSWFTYGQKEIYDGPLTPSLARHVTRRIARERNLPFSKVTKEVMEELIGEYPGIIPEGIILAECLENVNIRQDEITYESLKKRYLEAFDPAKIMGEVQAIAMVDCKSKQFFVLPVGKMLEYLQPNGVSKGVPSFKPTLKLRGPKKPRKKSDKKKV